MSEQILNQILDKLNQMDVRMDKLDGRIDRLDGRIGKLDGRIDRLQADIKSIKADTADIPLIRRAVLETNDIAKHMDNTQKSFERKATSELNTHTHSIDILNRRQLKLEAEVEHSKNR